MRFENKEFSEFKVWEGRKDYLQLRLRILRLSYKFFAWTGIMEFRVDIDACYNSGSKIDTRDMGSGGVGLVRVLSGQGGMGRSKWPRRIFLGPCQDNLKLREMTQ
jgi:hypothetical protein